MAIFIVVSESANPELGKKIAATYPNDHFEISSDQWLVSADKITKDVAEELNIRGGARGRAVVFKIDSHSGFHNKTMWEWMNLKEAK